VGAGHPVPVERQAHCLTIWLQQILGQPLPGWLSVIKEVRGPGQDRLQHADYGDSKSHCDDNGRRASSVTELYPSSDDQVANECQ
jgi:hypothetical protein